MTLPGVCETLVPMSTSTTKRTNSLSNPSASTHDAWCSCSPCLANRIRRIDSFCEGLLAGFSAADNALEGGQSTGTRNLPAADRTGVFAGFSSGSAGDLGRTARPPRG